MFLNHFPEAGHCDLQPSAQVNRAVKSHSPPRDLRPGKPAHTGRPNRLRPSARRCGTFPARLSPGSLLGEPGLSRSSAAGRTSHRSLPVSPATGGLIPAEPRPSSLLLPPGRWGTQDLSEHPDAWAKPDVLAWSSGGPRAPGFLKPLFNPVNAQPELSAWGEWPWSGPLGQLPALSLPSFVTRDKPPNCSELPSSGETGVTNPDLWNYRVV